MSRDRMIVSELIAGRLNDAPEAWVRAVEALRPFLTRRAMRMIPDCEVDDLVQETIIRASSAHSQFREECNFKTFVCRILTNSASDYLTHRNKHHRNRVYISPTLRGCSVPAVLEADLVSPALSLFDGMMTNDLADDITSAIALLSPDERTLIELYIAGECYEKMAEFLSVPVGTIRSRIFRIRRQIIRKLPVIEYQRTRRAPFAATKVLHGDF